MFYLCRCSILKMVQQMKKEGIFLQRRARVHENDKREFNVEMFIFFATIIMTKLFQK